MKYGQKLKLGDDHVTPRNIQEVQALKIGDAPEAPLLHRQKSGHFQFQFSFLLFSAINGWTQKISLGEDTLRFSLPRTL
jgi:hypothetical protein